MTNAIRVEGAAELRRALRDAYAVTPKAIAQANKAASQTVVDVAQPLIPRRTGRLARSTRALGSQRLGRVRSGSASVPYAAAIHWGRGQGNVGSPPKNHIGRNVIQGRPFLWEAAQKARPQIVHDYRKAIDEIVLAAIDQGAKH